MSTLAQVFVEHISELERRAIGGDAFATRSLCAIVLMKEGWRPGDPDPSDDDPDGGERIFHGNVVDLMGRIAA